jgi:hypothetical protein
MKKIDIIYFDAGSGHRSAARGLQRTLLSAVRGITLPPTSPITFRETISASI